MTNWNTFVFLIFQTDWKIIYFWIIHIVLFQTYVYSRRKFILHKYFWTEIKTVPSCRWIYVWVMMWWHLSVLPLKCNYRKWWFLFWQIHWEYKPQYEYTFSYQEVVMLGWISSSDFLQQLKILTAWNNSFSDSNQLRKVRFCWGFS